MDPNLLKCFYFIYFHTENPLDIRCSLSSMNLEETLESRWEDGPRAFPFIPQYTPSVCDCPPRLFWISLASDLTGASPIYLETISKAELCMNWQVLQYLLNKSSGIKIRIVNSTPESCCGKAPYPMKPGKGVCSRFRIQNSIRDESREEEKRFLILSV